MKLAIMQPYFFPYLGYWQLMYAVDRFVVYDDVNYVKRGWINRNRILINGRPAMITIALQRASQNTCIRDLELHPAAYQRSSLLKTIALAYRKAPYFEEVFPIIEKIVMNESSRLSEYLTFGLHEMRKYMGIDTEIIESSSGYKNDQLHGQTRILDICKTEHASTYVNAIGGTRLYSAEAFNERDVELRFLSTRPFSYSQRGGGSFSSSLSIIDPLMELGCIAVRARLGDYELLRASEAYAL